MTPLRRHSRAKKNVADRWARAQHHQIQFPLMPSLATMPATASGVSAANVVATIEVPAMYQGSLRSPTKNDCMPSPASLKKSEPTPRAKTT
jgi:hypothetical protein